jgi:hypothetical protein
MAATELSEPASFMGVSHVPQKRFSYWPDGRHTCFCGAFSQKTLHSASADSSTATASADSSIVTASADNHVQVQNGDCLTSQDCFAFFFIVPFLLGVGSGSGSSRSSLKNIQNLGLFLNSLLAFPGTTIILYIGLPIINGPNYILI